MFYILVANLITKLENILILRVLIYEILRNMLQIRTLAGYGLWVEGAEIAE